ncbi:MAG: single-stranded DNA-binding protein [Halobacteriovorax sp.]|nr:single-stranded DNA-binding protein [Halobacteriovorax sp.]|tara:strand:+ start:126 stop:620 length:495 start_codon:yes stop_codon:yes gene_type:complete
MTGSHNSVTLVGRLGANPEIRQVGDPDADGNRKLVANMSIATNYRFKDKTGARVEKTDWHRIVIWNSGLIRVLQGGLLCKGKQVLVQGEIRTRQYEQDGITKYSTEIVLSGPHSVLTVLEPRGATEPPFAMPEEGSVVTAEDVALAKTNATVTATTGSSEDIPF